MSGARRWIIGRGLLGSAIGRARTDAPFHVAVDWASASGSLDDLRAGMDVFLDDQNTPWEIYWSAGRGVTLTRRETVMAEADVFAQFLDALSERIADAPPGVIFLGSSVGGAYAGSVSPPFTERTSPVPLSAYGEAKLRMEQALERHVESTQARGLIARVTNLYGPGQDLGKGQGLISVIVDAYVTGKPASIYVSMDTLRDYIYVDDCARVISAAMARMHGEPLGTTVTKIVGAMNAVSVGAIIGEVSRLRRKPAPLILGQGAAVGQARDLRVRSEVWTDLDGLTATTLPEGLGAVYRAQLANHMNKADSPR